MKIVFVPHENIDKTAWDDHIRRSPHGLIYAYSWFLDEAAPGWCALMSADNHYMMPLPVRTKWNQKYVYPPFFIQQLGIIAQADRIKPEITSAFMNATASHFRFAEMYLHEKCEVRPEKFMKVEKRINHLLSLDSAFGQIQSNYSGQLKRNLKKAMATGSEIRALKDASGIISLFRKSKKQWKANYKTEDYLRLEKIIKECVSHGMAEMNGVFDADNNLHAGAVFLKSHNRITFFFSGQTDYGRQNSLLALLINDVIKRNSGFPMVFDFEGSMDKGLARFYKSFGSLEATYSFVKLNRLPGIIKWLK